MSPSPVLFAQQQADVVEVRSLGRLLGPAALHQLTQFRAVALRVDGGPQTGPLAQNHPVHDLCGDIQDNQSRLPDVCSELNNSCW